MIFALSDLSFANLTTGSIRITRLNAESAAQLIIDAIKNNDLRGIYQFGEVESEEVELRFNEILDLLKDTLGVNIPAECFFILGSDGEIAHPTPYDRLSLSRDQSLLLLKYSFIELFPELSEQRIYAEPGQNELERTQYDAKLVETVLPMRINKQTLEFYHLEVVEE